MEEKPTIKDNVIFEVEQGILRKNGEDQICPMRMPVPVQEQNQITGKIEVSINPFPCVSNCPFFFTGKKKYSKEEVDVAILKCMHKPLIMEI
jgi:hypothetical protein